MSKSFYSIFVLALGVFWMNLTSSTTVKEQVPFGTQHIKPLGYYVDKKCISMLSWKEHFYYVKNNKGEAEAQACMPDTNVIIAHYGSNVFFSHDYKDSAVVGLSAEQIEEFCKWRSEVVKMTKKLAGTTVKYLPLDASMYEYLSSKDKIKGIQLPNSNLPELVLYNDDFKVNVNKETSIEYDDYQGVFGFRCVAIYE